MAGKRIRLGLSILVALLLAAWAASHFYRQACGWRASFFVREAEVAMGAGAPRLALKNLVLAQRMASQDSRVKRGFARYKFLQRDPRSLALWIELVNRDKKSAEDWEGLFLASMQAGNKKLAYRAIQGLKMAEPANKKIKLFECRLLVATERPDLAAQLAREIVRQPDQKEDVLLFAYEVMLSGTENDRQIALDWLWNKTHSDDMVGLSAAVILAGSKDRPGSQTGALIQRLRTHPLSRLEQRILAESLVISQITGGAKDKADAWVHFGKSLQDKERYILTRWILDKGSLDAAEKLLSREEALKKGTAARIYVDILGTEKKWEDLRAFLMEAESSLPENFRLLYLSRAEYEIGDVKSSDLHCRMALTASRSSPDSLSYMANYAAVMRWDDKAKEVCNILIGDSQTEGLGLNGLLMLAYKRGNQKEVEAAIRKIDAYEKHRSQ